MKLIIRKSALTSILFVSLLMGIVGIYAQSPSDQIRNAGTFYSEGKYTEAAAIYEEIISNGYASPELFYNLGNAYFKLNQIPSAILFYEKARKLNPQDEDILFNLNLANSRIIDKIEPLPEFFLKRWWHSFRDITTVDNWATTSVIFFILTLTAICAFILSNSYQIRRIALIGGIVVIVISGVSTMMAAQKYNSNTRSESAIIFTPTVAVKSSPSEKSIDLFVIHEGTKVFLTDSVEGWSEVRIADGNKGWIKSSDFQAI